jgi:hypothetical protein
MRARTTMAHMAVVYRRPAEDPTRPFHPHDDRIVSLGLHHTTGTGIAHDVIIDAWWTGP